MAKNQMCLQQKCSNEKTRATEATENKIMKPSNYISQYAINYKLAVCRPQMAIFLSDSVKNN